MAHAIKTVLTYNLDGNTKDFNIPFEYLARKFVVVTLIGVDRKVLVLNQDYRFATRTTISTTLAWGPAQGYNQIEIRRYTSATERLVDFTDGSILRAYDLNVAQVQTLHVAEEARDLTADTIGVNNDGQLDARGRRIVNLADAIADSDAISFGQVKRMNENAWQSRNEALQFRNEAEAFKNGTADDKNHTLQWRNETEQFKNQAFGFRNEAEQFKNQAAASQNAAAGSAQSAANSQGAAATSEANALAQANRATTEADRAKTEADKLGNWNQLAGAVDRVDGTTVAWKGEQRSPAFVISPSLNAPSPTNITMTNWGNNSGRRNVMEVADDQGWLWFAQRESNNEVSFAINGLLTPKNLNVNPYGGSSQIHLMGSDGAWRAAVKGQENGSLTLHSSLGGSTWQFHSSMIYSEGSPNGTDRGLLRGSIPGGGWDGWRDRSAGLLVDCQNSETSAHQLIKATHWGRFHIFGMDVHAPGGNANDATLGFHLGNQTNAFTFNGWGDLNAVRNGSFNDVQVRSDKRLKSNFKEITEALRKVKTLSAYTYDKKSTLKSTNPTTREAGIIAQELHKVLPEAVTEVELDGDKVLTISNSGVNALLVKAVQELSERVERIEKVLG